MQQPMQMQAGLRDPRQRYGLGSFVKKAVRGVKKIAKSPIGKMALMYAGTAGLGALAGGAGGTGFGRAMFRPGNIMSNFGSLGRFMPGASKSMNPFAQRAKGGFFNKGVGKYLNPWSGAFGEEGKFSGKHAFGLGAAALTAAPLFMGGKDDAEDVVENVVQLDPGAAVQSAKNYYSNLGDKGVGLNFMPKKKYVDQNFYAADGGRANYAGGEIVEDEEETIRTNAGQPLNMPQTFLNMGGDAGNAQAEQMLMAEYIKYKNKGGDLSFQEFVQAVMQQQEAQGMEQPTMMAADGGRIGYAGGQLVSPSNDGSRPGYAGESDIGILDVIKSFPGAVKEMFTGETGAFLGDNQAEKNKFMVQDMFPDIDKDTFAIIIDMNNRGMGIDEISSLTGQDSKTLTDMISILNMKAYGGRIGKQEGGIMATDEASEMIDMGGQEKDYRDEGGFVAMGGEERADDVPARLSKNEFVFTADAVRAAGGGDIDQGSEVMQNIMDNLEQGGQISEDSQGLGGEEIIEEPNGAQAMYNQQQALQSRMI